MIRSIRFKNFFNFRDETITFNPGVNVLVGINGVGKSNCLKAIALLKEAVDGIGLEKYLRQFGGITGVRHFNADPDASVELIFEFEPKYISKFTKPTTIEEPVFYQIKLLRGGGGTFSVDELVYQNVSGIQVLIEIPDYSSTKTKESELKLRNVLPFDDDIPAAIYFVISEWNYYDKFNSSLNSPLRERSDASPSERRLSYDADNLPVVLKNIDSYNIPIFDKIVHALNTINPDFENIKFDFIENRVGLMLKIKGLRRAVPADKLSDGTLLYLCFLAICLNPDRGGLICFDEPETGLHPDMIRTVADLFKNAAKEGTQFFIATHSPIFLNHFDLEDIIVFDRDEKTGEPTVSHPKEEDFPEWEHDFVPGMMWLRGMIGGKRW